MFCFALLTLGEVICFSRSFPPSPILYLHYFDSSQLYEVGTIIIPIIQMPELRLREVSNLPRHS